MLAYVAITRAQRALDNAGLNWIHAENHGKGTNVTADRSVLHPSSPETCDSVALWDDQRIGIMTPNSSPSSIGP
jgi:hypothetical protein